MHDTHRRTGPVSFRGGGGGGLRSVARLFSPLSSGFARILQTFLPENGYLKNSRGAAAPPPPHPAPASYAYDDTCRRKTRLVTFSHFTEEQPKVSHASYIQLSC